MAYFFNFCVILTLFAVSLAYPVNFSSDITDGLVSQGGGWWGSTLLGVLFLAVVTIALIGCMCCYPGKGFKEFRNSSNTLSVTEFVNPQVTTVVAQQTPVSSAVPPLTELTLFPPSAPRPAAFSSPEQPVSSNDWLDDNRKDFPRTQLQFLEEYGRGWFGKILTAEAHYLRPNEPKTKVIVKMLHEDATATDQMFFLHEVKPHRDLDHANILNLLATCLNHHPYLLIFEAYPNGDLKSFLQQSGASAAALCEGGVPIRMARDFSRGLEFMHAHRFVHTDLAARNALVTRDLTVKIGDYGNSIEVHRGDYYVAGSVALPVRWCAPETLKCTDHTIETKEVTSAANVWSLAVTIWEILEMGELPYKSLTDDEVIAKVLVDKERRVMLPVPTSSCDNINEIYHLLKLCWQSPLQRPTAAQVRLILDNLVSSNINSLTADVTTGKKADEFEARWQTSKSNNIAKTDNVLAGRGAKVADSAANLPIGAFTLDCGKDLVPESPRLRLSHTEPVAVPVASNPENVGELDSWLAGVEADTEEEQRLVRDVSDAIRELDAALELEKTSSSETSTHASPEKEISRDTKSHDYQGEGGVVKAGAVKGHSTESGRMKRWSGASFDSMFGATSGVEFKLGDVSMTHSSVKSYMQDTEEPVSLLFPAESSLPSSLPSALFDVEDAAWAARIERGEFSEKVKEKSRSIADLMVLTHIDTSDDSDSDKERSLGLRHNRLSLTSYRGSESDVRHAVLEESFHQDLKRLSSEHKHTGHFDSLNLILPQKPDNFLCKKASEHYFDTSSQQASTNPFRCDVLESDWPFEKMSANESKADGPSANQKIAFFEERPFESLHKVQIESLYPDVKFEENMTDENGSNVWCLDKSGLSQNLTQNRKSADVLAFIECENVEHKRIDELNVYNNENVTPSQSKFVDNHEQCTENETVESGPESTNSPATETQDVYNKASLVSESIQLDIEPINNHVIEEDFLEILKNESVSSESYQSDGVETRHFCTSVKKTVENQSIQLETKSIKPDAVETHDSVEEILEKESNPKPHQHDSAETHDSRVTTEETLESVQQETKPHLHDSAETRDSRITTEEKINESVQQETKPHLHDSAETRDSRITTEEKINESVQQETKLHLHDSAETHDSRITTEEKINESVQQETKLHLHDSAETHDSRITTEEKINESVQQETKPHLHDSAETHDSRVTTEETLESIQQEHETLNNDENESTLLEYFPKKWTSVSPTPSEKYSSYDNHIMVTSDNQDSAIGSSDEGLEPNSASDDVPNIIIGSSIKELSSTNQNTQLIGSSIEELSSTNEKNQLVGSFGKNFEPKGHNLAVNQLRNTMDINLNDIIKENLGLNNVLTEKNELVTKSTESVTLGPFEEHTLEYYQAVSTCDKSNHIINHNTNLVGDGEADDEAETRLRTPDDERSSDSGFRDKGSLSESVDDDPSHPKYMIDDIEAELEEAFVKGAFDTQTGSDTINFEFEESKFYETACEEAELTEMGDLDTDYFPSDGDPGWCVDPPEALSRPPDDPFVEALRAQLANALPISCRSFEMESEETCSDLPTINIDYLSGCSSVLSPIQEDDSEDPHRKSGDTESVNSEGRSPSQRRSRSNPRSPLLTNVDTDTFAQYLDLMVEHEGQLEPQNSQDVQEEGSPRSLIYEIAVNVVDADGFKDEVQQALQDQPDSLLLIENLEDGSITQIVQDPYTDPSGLQPLPVDAFGSGDVSITDEACTEVTSSPDFLSDVTPDITPFQSPRNVARTTPVVPIQLNNEAHEIIDAIQQLTDAQEIKEMSILDVTSAVDGGMEMMTSFCGEDDADRDPDWESDSDSSDSPDFVWKLHDDDDGDDDDVSSDESACSDTGSVTDFVPSAWDSHAIPSKSALKRKILEEGNTENKRRVWFKKEKYHCVYEYPREPSDAEEEPAAAVAAPNTMFNYSRFSDWQHTDVDSDACVLFDEDDFMVSSSQRPFMTGSEFWVGPHMWTTDSRPHRHSLTLDLPSPVAQSSATPSTSRDQRLERGNLLDSSPGDEMTTFSPTFTHVDRGEALLVNILTPTSPTSTQLSPASRLEDEQQVSREPCPPILTKHEETVDLLPVDSKLPSIDGPNQTLLDTPENLLETPTVVLSNKFSSVENLDSVAPLIENSHTDYLKGKLLSSSKDNLPEQSSPQHFSLDNVQKIDDISIYSKTNTLSTSSTASHDEPINVRFQPVMPFPRDVLPPTRVLSCEPDTVTNSHISGCDINSSAQNHSISEVSDSPSKALL